MSLESAATFTACSIHNMELQMSSLHYIAQSGAIVMERVETMTDRGSLVEYAGAGIAYLVMERL